MGKQGNNAIDRVPSSSSNFVVEAEDRVLRSSTKF